MIKLSKLIVTLTLITLSFATHAQPSLYTESQTSITITAKQPTFTLKLKSNPTTGYSWALGTYDATIIKPIKHYYQHSTSQLIGAGGFELWTFRVKTSAFKKPQTTTIHMMYARPWEKDKSGTQVVFEVKMVRRVN